jgi:transcriptional regulator with XRE-family HTH domain
MPMSPAKIGQLIANRRDILKLRQQDLSEMSGVAIKTIHLIEKGLANPSIMTMEKIATVLGLELVLEVKKNS